MHSDLALNIGLFAGWLALLVWILWPTNLQHPCHDQECDFYQKQHKTGRHKPPPTPPEFPDDSPTIRHDPDQRGGL